MNELPHWATGPAEILLHGISLVTKETDTNRRLAMIAIDNSIELMMQTYISLPKRITGIEISRKQRDEYCKNFPSLLDGLEAQAADRIVGLNLGEIEWFHRLRNELYHQGNGLTVEKLKVEAYSQLAIELFRALFEADLQAPLSNSASRLGLFLEKWIVLEKNIIGTNALNAGRLTKHVRTILRSRAEFKPSDLDDYADLRDIRNRVVHGMSDPKEMISDDVLKRMDSLLVKIRDVPF